VFLVGSWFPLFFFGMDHEILQNTSWHFVILIFGCAVLFVSNFRYCYLYSREGPVKYLVYYLSRDQELYRGLG
jgi:hypothetical protein